MNLSDELSRLADLHARGQLTDTEFARAKARLLEPSAGGAAPVVAKVIALRRSLSDRWVAGVCGGLAEATGAAAWVWRLVFALFAVCGGFGAVVYLLMWLLVPVEEGTARTVTS